MIDRFFKGEASPPPDTKRHPIGCFFVSGRRDVARNRPGSSRAHERSEEHGIGFHRSAVLRRICYFSKVNQRRPILPSPPPTTCNCIPRRDMDQDSGPYVFVILAMNPNKLRYQAVSIPEVKVSSINVQRMLNSGSCDFLSSVKQPFHH